jgi:phytoene dehydrogenase-like protein
MDANLDGTMVDVVVVGGGLAGWAAAASAATAATSGAGASVLLLESGPRGGRAASDQVGRFRFNRGAHALYTTGPGRRVLGDLGVAVKGAAPPLKGSQVRMDDRVGLAPGGPLSLLRTSLVPARDKLTLGRLLAGAQRWRAAEVADRTAAEWFDDLGLYGVARRMVELLARTATYCADMSAVSADVVVQQVQAALVGVEYLHGGWSTLVDGLAAAATDRGVRTEAARARTVEPTGAGVRVGTDRGTVTARRVVLAPGTPAATAALLPGDAAPWGELGPPSRVSVLDLGLATVPPTQALLGAGPPIYLICHAPSAAGLAPPGAATAQLMWYLRADEDPTPDEARAHLAAHARMAGIDVEEAEEAHYLHRMVAASALPTPATGGLAGRPGIDAAGLDGVLVAGDWVGPTGYLADASLCSGAAAGRAAAAAVVAGTVASREPAA